MPPTRMARWWGSSYSPQLDFTNMTYATTTIAMAVSSRVASAQPATTGHDLPTRTARRPTSVGRINSSRTSRITFTMPGNGAYAAVHV